MVLLRDLGVSIRRNARRLLHRLGITPADGRALRSCRTGRWRILRTARLLWPRTSSCGIAAWSSAAALCLVRNRSRSCRTVWCRGWRRANVRRRCISCHAGARKDRRSWMLCRRLRIARRIRRLNSRAALPGNFWLHISHRTAVWVVWHSCAADGICRTAGSCIR